MASANKLLYVCAVILSQLLTLNIAVASDGIRTVALTGDDAPGVEEGLMFDTFSFFDSGPPVLNNSGQVAFIGVMSGGGSFLNDTGIWSEGGGSGLNLVARDGSVAPGTNVPFSDFRGARLIINNNGQTAFSTILDTSQPGVTSSNFNGFWSEGGGSGLTLVARAGNPAPDTSDVFDSLHDSFFDAEFAFGDSGKFAFVGSLTGPGIDSSNRHGIWSNGGDSGLAIIARSGNAAPGTGSGANYSLFDRIAINRNGEAAFRASLDISGPGVDLSTNDGIWSERGGNLTLIAREGDTAPGVGSSVNWGSFDSNGALSINSHGQTAFRARLSLNSPGINGLNNGGVWSEGGGNGLELIARGGDQAPGTPTGVNFDFNPFDQTIALNDNGHTAFIAHLQGAEVGHGIWSEGGGNGLELVARTGQPAPGTESDVTFDAFVGATVVLNNNGQTAFWANLVGPGVDSTNNNDSGIWAQDSAGNLQLIAREGDLLDVSDDPLAPDLRTISVLSWPNGNTGNSDGRPSGFNDLGQLAFVARFTDGSEGVFVSNLVAIPEPNSALLAATALSVCLVRGCKCDHRLFVGI